MTHPVYLVRHGQSEWNVLRLTQGQTPHPRLTELGREQAESAARLIADDLVAEGGSVKLIVTSDLVRAVETAEIVAAQLGGVIAHDVRLREQGLGDLEGRGYDETWSAAEAFDWSDPTLPIAGGESLMDVYDRMAAALADLGSHGVTVVVSHGDAIRAAIAHLNGVKPHEADWVEVPNGAVARIDGGVAWLGQ
ncbi:histidine phosphatase family protein [Nocardioides sp. Kera G14]|uniref:histidine phosphatase family protein n=1 Tax=Nocardioides sp. Kera G14 TaxID=2884264 RepID=UPI001D0FCF04|nr:histidine phosphatase family protein [Nocardioides sp. Kera G14]UDY25041.1 histidine phosphatase family protein [Nocardioides sp. Kera G14]